MRTFEDKVAQRAIVMVLEAVYEQDFLPCSFGFRRRFRLGRAQGKALGNALPRITLRLHVGELGARLGDQGIGLGVLRRRLGRCLGVGEARPAPRSMRPVWSRALLFERPLTEHAIRLAAAARTA